MDATGCEHACSARRKYSRSGEAQTIKQTAEKPIIQEKINHVAKHIEVPQFLNKILDMPVVAQRQVSMVLKAMDAPQMQVVEKTVEVPQLQKTQTIQGAQTSESLGIAPACQATQAEHVEVVEIGVPLPTESESPMFVSTPVLELLQVLLSMCNSLPLRSTWRSHPRMDMSRLLSST